MDAGYTSPVLLNELLENGIRPIVPYISPKGNSKKINKNKFTYDEVENIYICPMTKKLKYKGVKSDGYLSYKTKKKDCLDCPLRDKCCNSSGYKEISRHLLETAKDITTEFRKSELGKELYPKRKETIERVFADTKFNHCLSFTFLRGLKKNQNRCLLIFAAANVKKFAILIDKLEKKYSQIYSFILSLLYFPIKNYKYSY